MQRFLLLISLSCICAAACAPAMPAAPLAVHEAYVWQHEWGPDTRTAVQSRPQVLQALHVLAGTLALPDRHFIPTTVDTAVLAGAGPIVPVVRVEGSQPLDGVSLQTMMATAQSWQQSGVHVTAIEIDYDCPTARLRSYAAWLTRQRMVVAPLQLFITALPAWRTSPDLPVLLATVDRVTVQLHAILAPALFAPDTARQWCAQWAAASQRPFWIALPTYSVRLQSGQTVAADPLELQRCVASLRLDPVPGLQGAVWYRLAYADDPDAWPGATLAAVIAGSALHPRIDIELRPAESGLWDIVARNNGNMSGPVPSHLQFFGQVEALEGVRRCHRDATGLACAAEEVVPPGRSVVLGFVRGQEVRHVQNNL